jgi:prevent-host-death family protein
MQTIKASDFKARCLALMDEVARTGEAIRVTKNGRPIAELRPVAVEGEVSPFGMWKGRSRKLGDLIAPVGVDDWEASA